MKIVPAIIVLIFFHVCQPDGQAAARADASSPEIQRVLEYAVRAVRTRPPVSFTCEMTFDVNNQGDHVVMRSTSTFRTDQQRFDISTEAYETIKGKDVLVKRARSIWDGKSYLAREGHPASAGAQYYATSAQIQFRERVASPMESGTYLDGAMPSDAGCAVELLATFGKNLSLRTESVDGYECQLIEGKTENGAYRVWLDPSNGYLARRISEHRESGDLSAGKVLNDEVIDVDLRDLTISRVHDLYIVTKGTLKSKNTAAGKVNYESTCKFERANVVPDPDFISLNAFKMDGIPERANITNFDYPGLRFIWQNGAVRYDDTPAIVSRINQEVANAHFSSGEANKMAQGGLSNWRNITLGICAIIVASGTCIVFLRRKVVK